MLLDAFSLHSVSFCYPVIKDYTVNAILIWLSCEGRNKQRVLINSDLQLWAIEICGIWTEYNLSKYVLNCEGV